MKVLVTLLVVVVFFNACHGGTLTDKFKEIGDNLKKTGTAIKDEVTDITKVLGSVAKSKLKSLASQSLQALAGAVITSFKGFDLGEILFGKRELGAVQYFRQLAAQVKETLDKVFKKTFDRFGSVIKSLGQQKSTEQLHSELAEIADDHELAARTIIGDTLNSGINFIKNAYQKLKDFLGSKTKIADPVMISKRGLLTDAWDSLMGRLNRLKEQFQPHYAKASEITQNVAAALKHYGGKVLEDAKEGAADKMNQTLGYLKDRLHEHLADAKDTFISLKDHVTDAVQDWVSPN